MSEKVLIIRKNETPLVAQLEEGRDLFGEPFFLCSVFFGGGEMLVVKNYSRNKAIRSLRQKINRLDREAKDA